MEVGGSTLTVAILTLSVVFQLLAAFLALRLIKVTGWRSAWLLLAVAAGLQAVRRMLRLVEWLDAGDGGPVSAPTEVIGLLISIVMLVGVFSIKPIFEALKRSEQVLRDSESRFRMLYEHAPLCYQSMDSKERLAEVNPAWLETLGYAREEVIGRQFAEFLAPDQTDPFERGLPVIETAGAISGVEFNMTSKDGDQVSMSLACRTPRRFDASSEQVYCMLTDITERKEFEAERERYREDLERRVAERTAELEEMNTQMQTFIYTVSHDLRAPLRAMRGFSDAILEDYGEQLDSEGREYAQHIVDAAKHMDTLMSDLLAYSRVERLEMGLHPIDLGDIVNEALSELKGEISESDATVDVIRPLGEVIGHGPTTVQIIANLVSNAIKFVSPGVKPEIRIRTEASYEYMRLWIEDNGIGIDPPHHANIFGVFERLHGIETYPGTGIGLAIVRKGIERMNGHFGVESALGQGSRFWIELPMAEVKK